MKMAASPDREAKGWGRCRRCGHDGERERERVLMYGVPDW